MKRYIHVFQFKIILQDIAPPIWRRIQVPETYSFWDLHVAIQDAMGWQDSHLHDFSIINPHTQKIEQIGIPTDEFDFEDDYDNHVLPGWEYNIADYFSMTNNSTHYRYDYGDDWNHIVTLENILPREKGIKYPRCVAGERSCPPEDCGGPHGYEDFVEIIMDPTHNEHENMIIWAGKNFDPERFDPNKVRFDNPEKRWEHAFAEG